MMKIAIEYLRASTDMQDHSTNDQDAVIKQWAKSAGYKVVKSYIDDGISGAEAKKRPAFLNMIDDSINNHWDAVLVYDSSRFARNLMEFLAYKKILKENGVQLIAVTEPQIDDDMSLFYDAINGASNEMYLRKLSRDVTRGLVQKAERGEYMGFAPYGFNKPKHSETLFVDEKEAEIVQYMYSATLSGKTYFEIVDELTTAGIKTHRGNYFDVRGVRRILENPLYKGWFIVNIKGKAITKQALNISGIIISVDVWDAVQIMLEDRRQKYRCHSMPNMCKKHWLSGLVRCACCQQTYVYVKRPDGRKDRFRCKGYGRGFCRDSTSVTVELLEILVLDKLQEVYAAPVESYQKNIIVAAPKNAIDYEKEIAKLQSALSRAKKAYLEEIDTIDEYKENKTRLTTQLEDMKSRCVNAGKVVSVDTRHFQAKLLNAIEVLKSDCTMEEKLAVSSALIERIVLNSTAKTLDIYFFA